MPLSLLLTLVSNIISKTEDDQNQDSDNGNDAGTGDDQNASPGNGTGDDQNASPGSGDDQGDDNDGGQQSGPTQTNLLMKRLRDKTSQQGRDLKDQQATIAEKDAEIQRLQAVIAQSAGNNASAAGNDEGNQNQSTRSGAGNNRFRRNNQRNQQNQSLSDDNMDLVREAVGEVVTLVQGVKSEVDAVKGTMAESTEAQTEKERVDELTEQGIPEDAAKAIVQGMDSDDFDERMQAGKAYAEQTELAQKQKAKEEREADARKNQLRNMNLANGGGSAAGGAGGDDAQSALDKLKEKPVEEQLLDLEQLAKTDPAAAEYVVEQLVEDYI